MGWMDTYADQIGSWTLYYVPAEVIEGMRCSHMLGVFFRMASDPPLNVWLGVGDIPAGFDGIDPEGTVYLGGGRLLGVPVLETLVNGQSTSVEFGLSGIDPSTANSIIPQLPDVRGADVKIGLTTLNHYYQPTTSIIPIWSGTASHTSEGSEPVASESDRTVTISMAVVSGNNTRSRPAQALWSSAHHKAVHPTDLFFDGMSRLGRGVAPAWPTYN